MRHSAWINQNVLWGSVITALSSIRSCSIHTMMTSSNSYHTVMTSWNGRIFRVAGLLRGEFTGRRWIPYPAQWQVTRSFDVFFDLHLNKRFSKQSRGWWFETHLRSLWYHCNGEQFPRNVQDSNHENMFAICRSIQKRTQKEIFNRLWIMPMRNSVCTTHCINIVQNPFLPVYSFESYSDTVIK